MPVTSNLMASSTNRFYPIIRFRWLIIISSVLLSLLMAMGMQNLAFNPDSRVFFSKQNPQLVAMEELENTFVKNENIYIALRAKQGDIFNTKTLALVKSLTEACWQIPYSSRVDSITNFQHMVVVGDDLSVDDLVTDPADLSEQKMNAIRQVVLTGACPGPPPDQPSWHDHRYQYQPAQTGQVTGRGADNGCICEEHAR